MTEYSRTGVLPSTAALVLGAPIAALLRLLPRGPKRLDGGGGPAPAREAAVTMRRMRDVDDALEPGIKAPARCSRGCGMMGRFWCLSLWLRAPLASLFTLYNPWLGRVSRMLAFYCHLAGPLWILAAWYDFYAEGFSECD